MKNVVIVLLGSILLFGCQDESEDLVRPDFENSVQMTDPDENPDPDPSED